MEPEIETKSRDCILHPQNSCLICYSTCSSDGDSDNFPPEDNKSSEQLLSSSLSSWPYCTENYAVFLLRVLLEIPKSKLEDANLGLLLKSTLTLNWIKSCDQCRKTISSAKEIYNEILETTRRFRIVQKEIVDILKKKCAENQVVSLEEELQAGKNNLEATVTNCVQRCKQFVSEHGFHDFQYPFVVQDLQSLVPVPNTSPLNNLEEDNAKCPVKWEIPDDLGDDDGTISLSPPQELLEQIMLILPEEEEQEEDDKVQGGNSFKDICPSSNEVVKEENISDDEEQDKEDVDPDDIGFPESVKNDNDKPNAEVEANSPGPNHPPLQSLGEGTSKRPKRRKRKRVGPLSSFKDLHECKLCEKSFKSLETLKSHQSRFHRGLISGKKKFPCPVKGCSMIYTHKGPLDVHVSQHRKKPTRMCGVCGMAFYHPEQLRRHKRQNHDPTYQKQQEEKLKKKTKRKASSSTAKDKASQPSSDFECPVCHKFLKSLDTLRYHVKKLHPNSNVPIKRSPPPDTGDKPLFQKQPYNLSRFDKLYPEMSAKITRNPDGKFPCPEPNCGGLFPRKDKLERHICTQHLGGDLLFRCTWEGCDKSFLKRESYEDHLDKHKGTPRLKCDVCGMQFYSRNPLTRHQEKEHQDGKNRKPFVCEMCGKAYACRDFLSTHKYIAHRKGEKKQQQQQFPKREGMVAQPTEDTSIICDLCGKLLKNKQNLKAHIKTVHEKLPRKHECHLCPKKFHISTHLKHHLYKAHKIKVENYQPKEERMERYQCPVVGCRLPFFNKELFQKHMKLKHGEDGQKAPQYKCKYCGKEYHLKFKLKHHEEVHENQETKPWKCRICEKGFLTSAHLKFHLKHTHKMKLEEVRKIVGAAASIKQEEEEIGGEGIESMLN